MELNLRAQFQSVWYAPVFSSILANRGELTMLAGISGLHLGLNLAGYSGWRCPILAATGVPCPGCGLTSAILQLIRGDVLASLRTHAFAPIFALVVLLIFIALILPPKPRERFISALQRFETRNGITSWVLLLLIFYWGIRLLGVIPFTIAY